ncbi:MAG TPA: hypothetical protein PK523_09355 [Elusimicrobiales bacterium]|nr:hypothetical protein [Elusimicrobiales bacterium]
MAENNKEGIFPDALSTDMKKLAARRACHFKRDGRYSPAAWLDFVGQFDLFAGRPTRPFRPIKGDKFFL